MRQPGLDGVRDLVEVMDRLRSPGGCPWDAEQTHASLTRYAVEEAYELADAVSSGDRAHLREELGDLLLQVVFHARIAQEHGEPFDLDDVARGISEKLRRRHPAVFTGAGQAASTSGEQKATWEQIKAAEKPERTSPLDGVPAGLPPLERAAAYVERLAGHGHLEVATRHAQGERPGARILAALVEAETNGEDAAAELLELVHSMAAEASQLARRGPSS